MKFKAVFLDFYGTLVHEDDDIIPALCEQVRASTALSCTTREIGSYWWQVFSGIFRNSYGESFQLQREIGIQSLKQTLQAFESNCVAEELIQRQFDHWAQPKLYDDTIPFLEMLKGVPVYILSNIDRSDILKAMDYHQLSVTDVLTSEDVRSYKPRPEMFIEALRKSGLRADEVVHIGDSLSNDVGGAQSVGIQAIWLNRLNKKQAEGITPDMICKDLNEIRRKWSDES